MTLMERFNKEFSLSEQSLNGLTETPFHHLRRQAMDIFTQKGLPTVRHEEWKYTNIFSVLQKPFQNLCRLLPLKRYSVTIRFPIWTVIVLFFTMVSIYRNYL
jgi:hypothetical protein